MKFSSYIFPQKIAVYHSPKNGEIKIMESFGKKYLQVGNLAQSGRSVEIMWKKFFRRFLTEDRKQNNADLYILLLGVAGGTVIKIINETFPKSKIIGIDIDPVMVEAGKEHFQLGSYSNLKIVIADAEKYILTCKKKYDLVIVDLFLGRQIPQFTGNRIFLRNMQKIINQNGMVIFNRLYFQSYKNEAEDFLDKVRKIFQSIIRVKIDFNLFIIAK